jgi:hypothetical protein
METENKDWKPEVGKTAWVILAMDVHEVNVTNVTAFGYYTVSSERWNEHDMPAEWVFPTPEAALASIKIYDLEGKEVVIPPRPLVLEPKPLEWKHLEMNEEAIAVDGPWSFYAWQDGSWEINYDNRTIDAGLFVPEDGTFDTAKAAIHEWRVNHLKSILP